MKRMKFNISKAIFYSFSNKDKNKFTCHPGILIFISRLLLPNLGAEKQDEGSNSKLSGKSKRVRTIFTPEQLERLEAEFERQQYMVGPERLYLAHTLQLTEAQVRTLKSCIIRRGLIENVF